jgi:hypothetical protein
MAAVTGIAIINVSGNLAVVIIGILPIMLVAEYAFKLIEIIRIDMAVSADRPLIALTMAPGINREKLRIVVEIALIPAISIVAIFAGHGITDIMVRHGIVIVALMAGQALYRCIIITIGVAFDTGDGDMLPCQRERGLIMIECHISPISGVVALSAIMAVVVAGMIGIIDIVIIIGMA